LREYCEVRRKLSEEFATAARLYSDAVIALTRFRDLPAWQHERFREEVEQAKLRAERAGTAFEEHVLLHRCEA